MGIGGDIKAEAELGINPKDLQGEKKVPLWLVPKAGLMKAAKVMQLGAAKYGPFNWRENPIREQVYIDAASRHLILAENGEDIDEESGAEHYAHVISCMLILIDAKVAGNLVDTRQHSPETVALLKSLTED